MEGALEGNEPLAEAAIRGGGRAILRLPDHAS